MAAAAAVSAYGADIVAHRGENTQAPENSIPAFKAAFANGGSIIEGDFYLTESGEMVCIHGAGELKKARGLGQADCKTRPRGLAVARFGVEKL